MFLSQPVNLYSAVEILKTFFLTHWAQTFIALSLFISGINAVFKISAAGYRAKMPFASLCRRLFCVVALLFSSACSQQDFGRPIAGPLLDAVDSGKPYVEVDYEARSALRAKRLAKALETWESESRTDSVGYDIGPGDILDIGVVSLESPGETARLKRTVSHE